MKAVRSVLEYLKGIGVQHVFGIPAGSVNAFFDELYDMPEITPILLSMRVLPPIWLQPMRNTRIS